MAGRIACMAGCKREMPNMDAALQAAWGRLPITGWWRCSACTRELKIASAMVGMGDPTEDVLPKESIGALNETASTITPTAKII